MQTELTVGLSIHSNFTILLVLKDRGRKGQYSDTYSQIITIC